MIQALQNQVQNLSKVKTTEKETLHENKLFSFVNQPVNFMAIKSYGSDQFLNSRCDNLKLKNRRDQVFNMNERKSILDFE